MNKILSIVVPSYNTEKFMKNILSSITESSEIAKLDVIVVDDGSADNTALETKHFVDKFPESVRLITKKNGGHGSTINVGIHEARGKYFKVVDADDWLKTDELNRFVVFLEKTKADLVLTPFFTYDDQTKKVKKISFKSKWVEWNHEYDLRETRLDPLPTIHCFTFRTSILAQNHIKIDENAFYVDVEYILYPIPFVKSFKFVNIPLYYYRINQATQSISITNLKKNKNRHEFVLKNINKYVNNYGDGLSTNQQEIIRKRLSIMIAAQFKIISLFPINSKTYKELKSFYNFVKQETIFNERDVNMPIYLLIKSHFLLLPIIHYLAILKMKFVHI